MSSVLSNYGGNLALTALLRVPGLHLAAHLSDPTVTGLITTEVAGGGYARQPITFAAPSGKAAASTRAQTFTGMPACVVTYLAVWTAVAAGSMVAAILLPTPITVAESGQLLVASGDVAVAL